MTRAENERVFKILVKSAEKSWDVHDRVLGFFDMNGFDELATIYDTVFQKTYTAEVTSLAALASSDTT